MDIFDFYKESEAKLKQSEAKLKAIRNARSSKTLTSIGMLTPQFHLMKTIGLKARIKSLAQKLLLHSTFFISKYPKIKKFLTYLLVQLRVLKYFRIFYDGIVSSNMPYPVLKVRQLSPRARKIYHELKMSIKLLDKGDPS